MVVPTHCSAPRESMTATASQSPAIPSARAKPSMVTPISSVRGSFQASSREYRRVGPPPTPLVAVAAAWSAWAPRAPSSSGRKRRTARTAPSRTTTEATSMWGARPTDRYAARAANPAPTTVPALHAPWKRGMIVVPRRRSTSAASTFMATSQAPLEKPQANSASMSRARSGARPAEATPRAPITAAPRTTGRTPRRWTSVPAVGRASTAPTDAARRVSPSC